MVAVKRLTLLRHAKAQPGDPSTPDKDRPLNERGERDAPVMGLRLRERSTRPSLILTSPATRALQTARLVARELGYPREFLQREAELYLASPAVIRGKARQDDTFNNIRCAVNPGLTELANQLTGADIDNIPTCGPVTLETPVRHWKQLARSNPAGIDFPANYPINGVVTDHYSGSRNV
jgi:phosphohistidine phosphatase